MIQRIRIALIGSRSLHRLPNMQADIELCHQVCARFARLGIVGVSGLCEEGMDAIMQKEYSRAIQMQFAFQSQLEVYVANIKDRRTSTLPHSQLAVVMNPSKRVLDNFGMPMGGTGVAIKMAQKANIPVFNLNTPDKQVVLNQIASFLKSKKVSNIKK